MKARYYSHVEGKMVNKLFVEHHQYRDLILYLMKSQQGKFDTLFAIVRGTAVPVVSRNIFESRLADDRLPKGFPTCDQELEDQVKQNLKEWHERDPLTLPGYAVSFGFSEEQIAEYKRLLREKHAKKSAERAEEYRQKQAKAKAEAEAKFQKEMSETRQAVLGGEKVDSATLVEFARFLGIDVHPRTAGMLFKRVNWVSKSQCSFMGRRLNTRSPFDLYEQCISVLESQEKAA